MDHSVENAASALTGLACVWVVLGFIIALYPLIALGRIWYYTKLSSARLAEIRDLLAQR